MHVRFLPIIAGITTLASLSLAQLAPENQSAQPATQPTSASSGNAPSATALASREYFTQVCDVIDHTLTQPPAKAVPSFYTNAANKITTLPKDNVDSDVVAWGGTVALTLTNAANALDIGKDRAESRADSVPTPQSTGDTDPNKDENARVQVQNAQQARRQGALEEKAAAGEQVANLLAKLQDSRTKVAAQLTARYGGGQQ